MTLRDRFSDVMMPTYGAPPVALVRGHGCRVTDEDGRDYLDLIGGIAVSALGHGHPALVRAVSEQVATLAHTSNLFVNEPSVRLAEKLLHLLAASGPGRVFFTNSGTEATEAGVKLALKAGNGNRVRFVAATGAFHGRSLGALSLTAKAAYREPFGPPALDVVRVPYDDPQALASAVDETTAAVVIEPTQGEAGVVPGPDALLDTARRACDRSGALLIIDEVQSGIGRTGAWFAHQGAGVRPDVLLLAKGLGGGLPIGACVGFGRWGITLGKGDHGSTFAGNPVAAAAALAVLDTIESAGLLENARAVGDRLAAGITGLGAPIIAGTTGSGLWRAIVLTEPIAPDIEAAARDAGFLLNAVTPDRIRLAPPLILTAAEADEFLAALPGILQAATSEAVGSRP
ncbi:MAG: acetylornithine transaminase [Mycobacteriales bacterium]